ncbi:MAG: hypothetical protein JNN30_16550 [Rhodanobacteraceae bacterium]|nr:hypothetical protein [Rhodanobacteraceae bacterium]
MGIVPAGLQQEAAVRLFETGELTVSDDADLFALLTSAHGIEDPLQRKARVFSADLVIPDQAAGKIIRLQSIRNLRNINALAEGKTLSFAAEGLTVIYGDNGSGKSGYARVFKKACRARDRDDPVLPNANRPTNESGPAQAEFDMLVDGVTVPAIWKHGEASPDVLASLAIFDARCARAYLDEQDDYAYAPYGMDILRELAAACGRLKTLLDQEQKKTTPNTSAFSHLKGQPTGVGKFLDQLSAATKIADLDALATLTPEEISESERLQKALNETNPKEKAQQLRLRGGRLIELGKRCTRAMAVVDDGVVDQLQQLVKKSATAKAAVNIATENFKSGSDYLPGTGGEEWKALFEAARKFATEAYPGQTFPALGADAPCPLCQQPLGTAVERLHAFNTYIQTDAEKQWRSSQSAAKAAIDVMSKANLDIGFDTALHVELRALDSSLADQMSQIELRLDQRRIVARDACYGKATWADLPTLPENPVSGLHALAQAMQREAEALEKLVDEVTAAAMSTRSRDLAGYSGP